MSRGPGRIQQAILKLLDSENRRFDTLEVAVAVYAIEPDQDGRRLVSHPQYAAVRRALTNLAKQNKVVRMGHQSTGRQCWANHRWGTEHLADREKYMAFYRAAVRMGLSPPPAEGMLPFSTREIAKLMGVSKSTALRDGRQKP